VLVDADDLGLAPKPASPRRPQADTRRLRDAVDDFTKHLIAATVTDCGGNWAEAARRLGLQRGNLHRLAARLRMERH
jgi:anaerobic nitric oxide reductase transcription regulator